MEYKYQYHSDEDRSRLLLEYEDKVLVEEQNLFDGSFLIFADEPRPVVIEYIDISKSEVDKVKEQLAQTNADFQSFMDLFFSMQGGI